MPPEVAPETPAELLRAYENGDIAAVGLVYVDAGGVPGFVVSGGPGLSRSARRSLAVAARQLYVEVQK